MAASDAQLPLHRLTFDTDFRFLGGVGLALAQLALALRGNGMESLMTVINGGVTQGLLFAGAGAVAIALMGAVVAQRHLRPALEGPRLQRHRHTLAILCLMQLLQTLLHQLVAGGTQPPLPPANHYHLLYNLVVGMWSGLPLRGTLAFGLITSPIYLLSGCASLHASVAHQPLLRPLALAAAVQCMPRALLIHGASILYAACLQLALTQGAPRPPRHVRMMIPVAAADEPSSAQWGGVLGAAVTRWLAAIDVTLARVESMLLAGGPANSVIKTVATLVASLPLAHVLLKLVVHAVLASAGGAPEAAASAPSAWWAITPEEVIVFTSVALYVVWAHAASLKHQLHISRAILDDLVPAHIARQLEARMRAAAVAGSDDLSSMPSTALSSRVASSACLTALVEEGADSGSPPYCCDDPCWAGAPRVPRSSLTEHSPLAQDEDAVVKQIREATGDNFHHGGDPAHISHLLGGGGGSGGSGAAHAPDELCRTPCSALCCGSGDTASPELVRATMSPPPQLVLLRSESALSGGGGESSAASNIVTPSLERCGTGGRTTLQAIGMVDLPADTPLALSRSRAGSFTRGGSTDGVGLSPRPSSQPPLPFTSGADSYRRGSGGARGPHTGPFRASVDSALGSGGGGAGAGAGDDCCSCLDEGMMGCVTSKKEALRALSPAVSILAERLMSCVQAFTPDVLRLQELVSRRDMEAQVVSACAAAVRSLFGPDLLEELLQELGGLANQLQEDSEGTVIPVQQLLVSRQMSPPPPAQPAAGSGRRRRLSIEVGGFAPPSGEAGSRRTSPSNSIDQLSPSRGSLFNLFGVFGGSSGAAACAAAASAFSESLPSPMAAAITQLSSGSGRPFIAQLLPTQAAGSKRAAPAHLLVSGMTTSSLSASAPVNTMLPTLLRRSNTTPEHQQQQQQHHDTANGNRQAAAVTAGLAGSRSARVFDVDRCGPPRRSSSVEGSGLSPLSRSVSMTCIGRASGGGSIGGSPALTRRPSQRRSSSSTFSQWHPDVSVLFADIVGFTEMSDKVAPSQVLAMLNELYVRFDDLATKHDIYKVETVGDCYMAAAGLFDDTPDHARKMLLFATEMQAAARQVVRPDGQPVVLRIGVHSGRVMSGVIGKIRQRFCLFGDTVNTASRMESAGVGGMIHVSEATHAQLAGCCPEFSWYCRGPIPIKGKGPMTTYFLVQPGQCRCHDDDDGQGAASAAELLQVTLSAASNGATVKMSGAVSFNNAAADAAASCDESAAVSGFF